eukprot:scaffold7119_cov129-Isochrysis_galbana.AAC.4
MRAHPSSMADHILLFDRHRTERHRMAIGHETRVPPKAPLPLGLDDNTMCLAREQDHLCTWTLLEA